MQDWGSTGSARPTFVYFLYAFKLVVYVVGAIARDLADARPGRARGDFSDWWTEPIVFQKLAVWTLLWEILGLGAGSMPLSFRFNPPIGGPLYWLRPRNDPPAALAGQGAADGGLAADAVDVLLYAG